MDNTKHGKAVYDFLADPFRFVFFTVLFFLLIFGGIPGFRDGAHFYGPLFEYLFEELRCGRFPLWNPYENLGQPLAANPTSLLFYPGTYLVFIPVFLDWIDSARAYSCFVSTHFLLALWTSYRLARCCSCSRHAASLTALSYALGGSVLFQFNNVPFLIGAAWLPEALRQFGKMIEQKKIRNAVRLALVLNLMILGGDPQNVYHVGIVSGIFLIFFARKSFLSLFGLLVLSAILTVLLSAVQILPAWELNGFSDRILPEHQATICRFSIPVWRLSEFVWPGIGGWQFPVHARWFSALPGENGIWVPSLYQGLIPFALFLLVLLNYRSKTASGREKKPKKLFWFFLIVLFLFLLGSLGKNFVVYPMFQRLPAYETFRYPGKLLTVASLMVSILAGWGFDLFFRDRTFQKRFFVFYRIVVALGIGVSLLLALSFFFERIDIPACPLFGPFDSQKAISGLLITLFAVLVLYIPFEMFFRSSFGLLPSSPYRSRFLKSGVLFLVFLDLCFANAWMLTTQNDSEKNSTQSRQSSLANEIKNNGSNSVRVYRFPLWYPPEFSQISSENRLAEIVRWERDSLYPRYPLSERIDSVDVRGTLMLKDYRAWTDEIRKDIKLKRFDNVIPRLEKIGVEYVIAPENRELDADLIAAKADWPSDVSLWKLRHPARRDFVRYEPNRIVFDISLEQPETVVLTEQYFPGWRAFVGNQEFPMRKVEPVFRGVELPAGQHRVELVYDPPLIKIGGMMSAFGLLIALSFLLFDRFNRQES